jgi:hypothetical protein
VQALEYEAHQAIAEKEGARIVAEAMTRFAVTAVYCEHRVGKLAIGDCAVWVGVSADHRGAAFDACRYVIDEAKARVPIWKKEHYASVRRAGSTARRRQPADSRARRGRRLALALRVEPAAGRLNHVASRPLSGTLCASFGNAFGSGRPHA